MPNTRALKFVTHPYSIINHILTLPHLERKTSVTRSHPIDRWWRLNKKQKFWNKQTLKTIWTLQILIKHFDHTKIIYFLSILWSSFPINHIIMGINKNRSTRKITNAWKLNNSLLKVKWVKRKIKKFKDIVAMNENEYIWHTQTYWIWRRWF